MTGWGTEMQLKETDRHQWTRPCLSPPKERGICVSSSGDITSGFSPVIDAEPPGFSLWGVLRVYSNFHGLQINPRLHEHRLAAPLQVWGAQSAIHEVLQPDSGSANGSVKELASWSKKTHNTPLHGNQRFSEEKWEWREWLLRTLVSCCCHHIDDHVSAHSPFSLALAQTKQKPLTYLSPTEQVSM